METPVIPRCNGTESHLAHCWLTSRDDANCQPLFIDCSSQDEVELETPAVAGESSRPTDSNEPDDKGRRETSFGLGAIIAMAVVIVVMTVLVLVSVFIIMRLWCWGRRNQKSKISPKTSSKTNSSQNNRYLYNVCVLLIIFSTVRTPL